MARYKLPGKRETLKLPRQAIRPMSDEFRYPLPVNKIEALRSIVRAMGKGTIKFTNDRRRMLPIAMLADKSLIGDVRFKQVRGTLSVPHFLSILDRQGCRCAFTDLKLYPFMVDAPEYFNAIGLDLIDKCAGLCKSNVRAVCWPMAVGKLMVGESDKHRSYTNLRSYGLNLTLERLWHENPNYSAYFKSMVQIVYTVIGKAKKLRPLPITVSLDLDSLKLQGYYCHPDNHRFITFSIGHISFDLDEALVILRAEGYFMHRDQFKAVIRLNHPDFDEILVDKIIALFCKSYRNEAQHKVGLYVHGVPFELGNGEADD